MKMELLGTLLLVLLGNFISARVLPGPSEALREDCSSAWECCSYEFLSVAFQRCCYDHGCCPLCDKFWSKGCFYNSANFKFGSVVEYHPQECKKLVCVAKTSTALPYVTGVIVQTHFNPDMYGLACSHLGKSICIDDFGIYRHEHEEWFVSSTCQQCWCINGLIKCQPGKWKCPMPSHPNCIAKVYGCCPQWDCGEKKSVCPDPDSFGRVCIQYFDQCHTDLDCGLGNICCLVAGCGKECMSPCVDDYGVTHNIGETWCNPGSRGNKLICQDTGIFHVEGSCSSVTNSISYQEERSSVDPPRSLHDCLIRSGLNLTLLAGQVETLEKIVKELPFKDFGFYVEAYKTLATTGNITANETLKSQDILDTQNFARRFQWDSVIPLLSTDTTRQQSSALSAGEIRLQINDITSRVQFTRNISVEEKSPSEFHQVAFRRTDPISTNMAQLGYAVGEATTRFVQSLNLPSSSAAALRLLGEADGCERRFNNFFRPVLEDPCDPLNTYRSIDGTCNNLNNDLWGASFTKFRRILSPDYGDGISSLRTALDDGPLPSARLISRKVNSKPNEESPVHSFILVTFGQFIDHDLTATPIAKGYLGSAIKCCDDLSVRLDSAAINLNATKLALADLRLLEPSLRTLNLEGELNVASKILDNLIAQGEKLIVNSQQFFNSSNVDVLRPFFNLSNAEILLSSNGSNLRISNFIKPFESECAPIPIPLDDDFYSCYGQTCMEFVRSAPAPMCRFGPREQLNQHTAYLDGSGIYGPKKEMTDGLREFQDGLLKLQVTLEGKRLLPGQEDPDDGCNIESLYANGIFCFKAGDGRVNEQIVLAFLHTVWAREHNRIAAILKAFHPSWTDEKLFQESRRIVIAELQHVTYTEFLPIILGTVLTETLGLSTLSLDQYTTDYDDTLDASIANSFSTAAYRYGHSQIADFIQRINRYGVLQTEPISAMMFNPFSLYEEEEMGDVGRGSTSGRARKVDAYFTEEVTGKLFKGKGKFGLDLVALNIQRGRDHGLPGYAQWKELCGGEVSNFSDLLSVMDEHIVDTLQEVYSALEDVDLFIGGISENPFLDGLLGPTFSCIIADQFLRIKKGDRFWYEYKDSPGSFTNAQLKELHKVTFARILCNNVPELENLQPNPFKVPSATNPRVSCHSALIGDYSLSPWDTYY
ncbi:lactoperoxidase-like isoform X2 [Palaemon carinicauda]|uniref:lactoperoxidase-like isoform X2 n=1 Tax=Palaemon carinicauda TaxID=392227 RepID=UPI0035B5AD99